MCLKASDNVGLVDELVRVRAQIEQRLELGDELGVPREIDHSARFRRLLMLAMPRATFGPLDIVSSSGTVLLSSSTEMPST